MRETRNLEFKEQVTNTFLKTVSAFAKRREENEKIVMVTVSSAPEAAAEKVPEAPARVFAEAKPTRLRRDQIAARIARERGSGSMSAQAVGGAVGHNPISVIVPCHRVVGRNGELTGYAGGIVSAAADGITAALNAIEKQRLL